MTTTGRDGKFISGVVDYQKLEPGSVRMVLLEAGRAEEPPRLHIETVRLDSIGDNFIYNALSYTYSHQERDCPMFLNNKPVMVTKQLSELFHEVQKDIDEGWCSRWWIDQICINQDDDEDKAQQIPYMRTIYERANYVTIWLRPGLPEDGENLFRLIHRLTSLSRRPGSGYGLDRLPVSEILGPPTEENFRSWRALKDLMNHKYWTRTWILPEACARADRSFVVGGTIDQGIQLSTMFFLRIMIRKLVFRRADCPPEFSLGNISSSLVGRVDNFNILQTSKTKRLTLFDYLHIMRRTECTRPEDKIFSVLAFANDVGDYVNDKYLKPTYAHGCGRLYSDIIKWYVVNHRNLNFLGYCVATKEQTSQIPGFDLPSWIPNWTHAVNMRPLFKFRNRLAATEDQIRLYNACGLYSDSIDVVEVPSDRYDAVSLFCSGIRIATVHRVLNSVSEESAYDPSVELSWQDEVDANVQYKLTGESYQDAYERTIVADAFHDVSNTISRPGRVRWWHNDLNLDPTDITEQEFQLKVATLNRALFFARSSPLALDDKTESNDQDKAGNVPKTDPNQPKANCESYLMGLGRSDIEVGDEIWALKGGQVLYVLRDRGRLAYSNTTETPEEPDSTSLPVVLWMNGKSYPWDTPVVAGSYSFVGECYVHGLMDGEVLQYASLEPGERPEMLRDMASDFREIFIGGVIGGEF